MSDDISITRTDDSLLRDRPTPTVKDNVPLSELARQFHLFTLGPVYVGAKLETNLLEVFAEQEDLKFESVTVQQSFPMFKNLEEWDYMIQGIEKRCLPTGAVDNSLAHQFSQFLQGWEFMRRETRFYAKIYSRPVQIVPPGVIRGTSVEVFLLTSNKGTQIISGANPYEVSVDPIKVPTYVARDAKAVFDVLRKDI